MHLAQLAAPPPELAARLRRHVALDVRLYEFGARLAREQHRSLVWAPEEAAADGGGGGGDGGGGDVALIQAQSGIERLVVLALEPASVTSDVCSGTSSQRNCVAPQQ